MKNFAVTILRSHLFEIVNSMKNKKLNKSQKETFRKNKQDLENAIEVLKEKEDRITET